jgi:TPP-dependent indolepyruvate ferredoxin oxidoreductase alpha subunit
LSKQTLFSTLARALHDAGVRHASHVPGFGASQTFNAFNELVGCSLPVSFHEEVAYGVMHGAALAGLRSACIIKSHGLTKAMNAVMDSLSSGVTAGFITLVFEDKGGSHSDNIIDIVPVLEGSRMPYKVGSIESAYDDVLDAFEFSEQLQLPVAIVFDADEIELDSPIHERRELDQPPEYTRDISQHLVCPIFAEYQHHVLDVKLSNGDWTALAKPARLELPTSLPTAYQNAVAPYLDLFRVFGQIGAEYVTGDAGVSTLSALWPFEIVNTAGYMGGSLPLAMGALLSGKRNVWAFTGDFSFIAAGHIALTEALLRKLPLKVLVYANGTAQTTGGQQLDLALLDRVLGGYKDRTVHLRDPHDPEKILKALKEAMSVDGLAIVVAHYT